MFWWHMEPAESWEWFKKTYSGRYLYLLTAKNKFIKWTDEALLEVRRKIKEADLKGLIIAPELLTK